MNRNQKPALSTKAWIVIVGALTLVCLLAWLLVSKETAPHFAEIYQDGMLLRRVSLDQDADFTIECDEGYNRIEVSNGQIRIAEADCRDQTCVNSGALNSNVPIVCLPHRLVIQVAASSETEYAFDAVTG